MKTKIVVFFIAALFVFTTFAGASVIQTKRLDHKPCPASVPVPGLREFHFNPKGESTFIHGTEYKNVEKNTDVNFKTKIRFYGHTQPMMWNGQVVLPGNVAKRIELTWYERKDGGSWNTILTENINRNEANSDYYYTYKFSKNYDEEGKYEIRVSGKVFFETRLGEVYYDDPAGDGSLYTLTLGVGDVKTKQRTPLNLILEFLHSILNNDNIFFQRLLNY